MKFDFEENVNLGEMIQRQLCHLYGSLKKKFITMISMRIQSELLLGFGVVFCLFFAFVF